MTQEIYNIHAYDLVTFVQEIEKAVKLGFEVDLHGVDNYPRLIGYQYLMRLVKSADVGNNVVSVATPETEAEKEVPVVAQVEQPKKRGPKGKAE